MADIPLTEQLSQTLDILSPLIPEIPTAGIITGTGLSHIPDGMDIAFTRSYDTLPHFPRSTVESHAGELIYGQIDGCPLLIFQGRFHLYEGYTPPQVTYPVRLLQALGVKRLVLTNAAGGLSENFTAGDIMAITDHINLTGANPLTGPNDDALGLRFPDMTRVYSQELIKDAQAAAQRADMALQEGVYAGLSGPSLETPAETRYLKIIGAQAVGFSTIMEAIAAVHADMDILGLSMITNLNDPDRPEAVTLESVLETAAHAAPRMTRLVAELARSWSAKG